MIAYAVYSHDARIRREAEALASTQDYKVLVLSLKEATSPRTYFLNGIEVIEVDISKYRGGSNIRYFLSYLNLMISAFFVCNKMLIKNSLDIIHIHNMPNFLIFSAIIPRLLGKIMILDIHDTLIETYAAKFEESSNSRVLSKLVTSILRLEEFISCILARKIICVNHIQREALIKRGISENKILILLNVPDPSLFGNNERITQQTHASKNFKLIYHGLVTRRQSVDLAIRAVANFFMALIARMTRATMLEVLGEDYIRTARARGVGNQRLLLHHALKNAAVPIVTTIGLGIALLLGGVIITESVFAIPGIGRLTVDSVLRHDYPVIQGIVLVVAAVYVFINLAIDLLYTVLDPRIRY